MDKKLKLNAKMNIAMAKTSFWIGISSAARNVADFVLNQAFKAQSKEFDIIREMLNEDYSEDYKKDLKDILKMKEDLA